MILESVRKGEAKANTVPPICALASEVKLSAPLNRTWAMKQLRVCKA